LVKELNLHGILDRQSVYMSRCGKAFNDGIDLEDLSQIVPLIDYFLGSPDRTGWRKENQCNCLFLSPALILMGAW
jgi:hypothetical protein